MRLFEWKITDDETGNRRTIAQGTSNPDNPGSLNVPLMALVKMHYPDGTGVQVIARGHGPTGTDGGGVAASMKLGPVPPDTANHFNVGARGDDIVVLSGMGRPLSRERALNLAAWLVALADEDGEFDRLLEAVKAT